MENKSPNKNQGKLKGLLVYLGIPIIIILIAAMFFSMNKVEQPTYSDILSYFEEKKVTEF